MGSFHDSKFFIHLRINFKNTLGKHCWTGQINIRKKNVFGMNTFENKTSYSPVKLPRESTEVSDEASQCNCSVPASK